jgi:hypothetical protein
MADETEKPAVSAEEWLKEANRRDGFRKELGCRLHRLTQSSLPEESREDLLCGILGMVCEELMRTDMAAFNRGYYVGFQEGFQKKPRSEVLSS